LRVDMSWVTKQQWLQTAEVLLVKHESFSENVLGRGLVFPTYGPEDPQTGRKLGFRYFREQCEEAGLIEKRGRHENAGYQLTEAGYNFLKRMLEEDGQTVTAVFEPAEEGDYEEDSDGEAE